ncbi:MAG: hypothetical protein ACXW6T_14720, partial [Candidatus Binatia bacterium]
RNRQHLRSKDGGDSNRTSHFACTGNRFEFRAVGSNHSIAGPLVAPLIVLLWPRIELHLQ